MLSARGSVLLFADADGATKFSDITKLENCLSKLINSKLHKFYLQQWKKTKVFFF